MDDAQLRAYLDRINGLVEKARSDAKGGISIAISNVSVGLDDIAALPPRGATSPPTPTIAPEDDLLEGKIAWWFDEGDFHHPCRITSLEGDVAVVRYGSGNKEVSRRMDVGDLYSDWRNARGEHDE